MNFTSMTRSDSSSPTTPSLCLQSQLSILFVATLCIPRLLCRWQLMKSRLPLVTSLPIGLTTYIQKISVSKERLSRTQWRLLLCSILKLHRVHQTLKQTFSLKTLVRILSPSPWLFRQAPLTTIIRLRIPRCSSIWNPSWFRPLFVLSPTLVQLRQGRG